VVVTSATDQVDIKTMAKNLGISAYMSKPFHTRILLEHLQSILEPVSR
jgi:DNA-binding response OmpR family regulator